MLHSLGGHAILLQGFCSLVRPVPQFPGVGHERVLVLMPLGPHDAEQLDHSPHSPHTSVAAVCVMQDSSVQQTTRAPVTSVLYKPR